MDRAPPSIVDPLNWTRRDAVAYVRTSLLVPMAPTLAVTALMLATLLAFLAWCVACVCCCCVLGWPLLWRHSLVAHNDDAHQTRPHP